MSKRSSRRIVLYLYLFLILLGSIPAVCYAAVDSGSSGVSSGAASGQSTMVFPADTTVESLKAELLPQGKGEQLTVIKPDGTKRLSGPIETGDKIEVTDETGFILSSVTAVISDGTPSAASSSESVSSGTSSANSSGASDTSSSDASSEIPSFIQGGKYSVFTGPVTMDDLKGGLQGTQKLKVVSASGAARKSGKICTGDAVSVLDSGGSTLCGTKAVVLGDLTRSGKITKRGCDLLYEWLAKKSTLKGDLLAAADVNQDGTVDTGDLLEMKKDLSESS